jgi:hypothetical protein
MTGARRCPDCGGPVHGTWREARACFDAKEAAMTDEELEASARDAEAWEERVIAPILRALDDMEARIDALIGEHYADDDEEDR